AEIVQYSLLDAVSARAANKANINPATTVVAGEVVNGDPERFFSGASPLSTITPAAVALAITHVQVLVGTSVDPLKGDYVADKTNALDQKFDQLKVEWNPATQQVTVTSKVTGTVVGTVSPSTFDTDKIAYLTQLTNPTVVPTTAPSFAALDTQFGAGLTAALAGSYMTALDALIDSTFRDGGVNRAALENELWSNGRGAVFGKFRVLGCGNTSTNPIDPAYQNKVVCRVAAPVTLTNGQRDFFEVRVIEKAAGTWLAWGDQRPYRVEVKAAALKSVRFDGGVVATPYQSGLQIWIPVPRGSTPDYEAVPNVNVATAKVFIGSNLIATLGTTGCSNSDYLQLMAVAGCVGNLVPMSDTDIQTLITDFSTSKTMPVVTVKLFDSGNVLLGSYDIKLAALPLLQADLTDATKPYQANFVTLNAASVTALSQLGAVSQPFNLAWTAGVSVENLSWYAQSSTAPVGGSVEVSLDVASVSFVPNTVVGPVNYASIYMTSRGSEGRKYWTKYFGCGGAACY
ncbi:MAG TPA: hypothetical protein VEQ09_07410, partial [Aquabacterium sp.]|nr:hypothetical protein [Aquabacterium sp.]